MVLPSILIGIGLTVSWNIISAERWIFGQLFKYFVPNWLWSDALNLTLLAVFVSLWYATKDFGAHCLSDILFHQNIFFQTSKMNSSFFLSITRTFFQLSLTDGFSSVYESLFEFFKIKIWGDFNNIVRQFCRVWSWILRAEYRCDRTTVTNMEKIFFPFRGKSWISELSKKRAGFGPLHEQYYFETFQNKKQCCAITKLGNQIQTKSMLVGR